MKSSPQGVPSLRRKPDDDHRRPVIFVADDDEMVGAVAEKALLAGRAYLVGWGVALDVLGVGLLPLLGHEKFMCGFIKFACTSRETMLVTAYLMILCGACRATAGRYFSVVVIITPPPMLLTTMHRRSSRLLHND